MPGGSAPSGQADHQLSSARASSRARHPSCGTGVVQRCGAGRRGRQREAARACPARRSTPDCTGRCRATCCRRTPASTLSPARGPRRGTPRPSASAATPPRTPRAPRPGSSRPMARPRVRSAATGLAGSAGSRGRLQACMRGSCSQLAAIRELASPELPPCVLAVCRRSGLRLCDRSRARPALSCKSSPLHRPRH